jgi:1,4-dihydroxy-2-naphthoate polyprenyltransferase
MIKPWIKAIRLRTLPLSVAGVLTGSCLAYADGAFKPDVFGLAMITTLLLQILSNLANDLGDYQHGTDNVNRVGPARAVQSGQISPKAMKRAVTVVGLLAFHGGMFLLTAALDNVFSYIFILFLITGLVAIGSAIKYTIGKHNFGYKGYGDIFVFAFFGIIGVWGTYVLHTLTFNPLVLMPAAAIGLLSAGVLNLNNMRDIDNDKLFNKNTLAVKLGATKAKAYHFALIVTAMVLIGLFFAFWGQPLAYWLLLFPLAALMYHLGVVMSITNAQRFDAQLKVLSLSTVLTAIIIGIMVIL